MADQPARFGFVVEQCLGHVTFQRHLAHWIDRTGVAEPTWYLVPYRPPGRLWSLPPISRSWSLRSGLWARHALRSDRNDALLFHTQVPALLSPDRTRRVPSFFSLDATPRQNHALGYLVGASQRAPGLAEISRRYTAAVLRSGRAVFAWSAWARDSLVNDYALPAERILVIHPGVPPLPVALRSPSGRPRLLFVGGDFHRKGGDALLAAFHAGLSRRCDLVVVTRDAVDPAPGVTVYHDLPPESPELSQLYREADVFVFPTRADASPWAVLEAMANGLPIVSTPVGAIPEMVCDGETGLLVPPDSLPALQTAIERLLDDAPERLRMGEAGRLRQIERFNAERNLPLILRAMDDRR